MFVQCAKFVERHHESASRKLSVFGAEKTDDTVPLAKMNLALHGLSGDIRQANSYYEDPHSAVGAFDYVMANPPFNVDKIKKDQLAGDRRFPFGVPKADNGNFLWIQQFYAALSPKGRAGFVMANSAGDAGHSEREIRKQLIESGTVDVMVAISSNFFYTVTLPVTLWFLDKAKAGTQREDTVLFLDARHIYNQIDRAHRDFKAEQIEFLANVVRLYRGEDVEIVDGSDALLSEHFPDGKYVDIGGLCKVATRAEIEAQGWSLNPGRYTGTASVDESDVDFMGDLEALHEEFTMLSDEAEILRGKIDAAVAGILGDNDASI
ncbi:N-6 DNA methylase (plasmid) [Sinomonas atrocyanea]|uniref:N-6 DNA methylase n=2 Tax=Sinomonas atrocyanea TaxID=37927 RepID=A0A127A5J9_9MICC|nr:N-6 DNA methylase [Sinomonas atrocyanea]